MAETDVRFISVVEVEKEMLSPRHKTSGHDTPNQRNRLFQKTLLLLVCIALCGLVLEGFFIYDLYKKIPKSVSPGTPANVPVAFCVTLVQNI